MKNISKLMLFFSALLYALYVHAHNDANLLIGKVVHYEARAQSLVTANYENTLDGHKKACNEIHKLLLKEVFAPLGYTRVTISSEPTLFQNGNVISVAGNCARTYWNDDTGGGVAIHPPHHYFLTCQGIAETISNGGKCEVNPKNKGMPCPPVLNPINPATGNKYEMESDYQSSGSNNLVFSRHYNSRDILVPSSLGGNWRHNYDRSVIVMNYGDKTYATVHREDGKAYDFTLVGADWVPDADVTSILTRIIDNQDVPLGWQYLTDSSQVENYDVQGRIISISDRRGGMTALTYNVNGLLHGVSNQRGEALEFVYGVDGKLVTLKEPSGGMYEYSYEPGSGNLSSVIYPDNTSRQYLYENASFPHSLTGIIDERGVRYATWQYDAEGRTISSEHSGGYERGSVTYNADGTATVRDANSNIKTYEFETKHGLVKPKLITD